MTLRAAPLRLVLLVLLAAASACGEPEPRPLPDIADLPLRGIKPAQPLGKVDFSMPDASGEPYDFHEETRGEIALLFFGYTYCPDICPVQMATLARALDQVSPEVRERVEVVFVTVDPERDTPERLRGWLAAFDSSFVGVRGSPEEIEEALAFYRYPPPERSAEGVMYTVGHPALVYGFTPDGLGRAMYGSETSAAVFAHDLELMTAYPWAAWQETDSGGGTRDGTAAGGGASSPAGADDAPPVLAMAGEVLVLDAYIPAPPVDGPVAVYLTLRNRGATPDTLRGFTSELGSGAGLHRTRREEGMSRMAPLSALPLPPGETVLLSPGGDHGMLQGVSAEALRAGDTARVTLDFALGGSVEVPVRVVPYADIRGGSGG